MDKIWDVLNSLLQPIFGIITGIVDPIVEQLAPIGLSEPVIKFMLVNAILAISIYLTLYCGMFSLANAGFMGIGAYVGAILTTQHQMQFGESLFYSMIFAGLIAIPIGLPVLRLKNIYLAIATIGFGEIVRLIILNFDKLAMDLRDSKTFSPIIRPILEQLVLDVDERRFTITYGARGITRIPRETEIAHLIVFLLALSYFLYCFHHSRMGRAMASIRQDERVASSQGINVVYYKNVAFFMGAMIAGAAGNFSAHTMTVIEPGDFGFNKAVDILAYAVLGGLGTWGGPIVGGLTLTAMPELLRELKEYSGIINGVLLLLIIVYLPNGITSLFRPSFWKEGGKFEMAKRLALAGIIIVALANLFPYHVLSKAQGRVLGYEFWGLIWGNMVIIAIFFWIRSILRRPSGGYFSIPLSVIAAIALIIFIGLGILGEIENVASGYYLHLLGMLLLLISGILTYPADRETRPAQRAEVINA